MKMSFRISPVVSEIHKASLKTCYVKDGVTVMNLAMSSDYYGYAVSFTTHGEHFTVISCNGKLTRADRRKLVKMVLPALKTGGALPPMDKIGDILEDDTENVRAAVLTVKCFKELMRGEK